MSDDVDDVGGSGFSLEDLSAYLDRGRTPRIPAIERNAECQALLASMERMGHLSREIIDEQAAEPLAESWYDEIMREVMREFRAGRDIPLARTADGTQLVVTEGALYELPLAALAATSLAGPGVKAAGASSNAGRWL